MTLGFCHSNDKGGPMDFRLDHRRTVHKTALGVTWTCSCGWTMWQRRAQPSFAQNSKFLKSWRRHSANTSKEESRC